MDTNKGLSNSHSSQLSNRSHFRRMTYKVILITSLFWICINLGILVYLMNDSSDELKIKLPEFMKSKSLRESILEQKSKLIDFQSINNKNQIKKPKNKFDIKTSEYLIEDYPNVPINPSHWPGENGRGVKIPEELKELGKKRFIENQFNVVASDLIALNRHVPDNRMEKCKNRKFYNNLPTTSIIIVFHNEANSTLLRGLTSIVNRTPNSLLKEIILVDDASEKRDYLHKPLDDFVKTLPVPVVIFRNEERLGLIRSRLRGAAAASGDTLTFLDAHIETTQGWILPLLTEIKKNRKAVLCPILDIISKDDFSYNHTPEDELYGGFDSSSTFQWVNIPERENIRRNNDISLPMRSPTMAGGLFTIDREYFYELGSYDDGMDIWGAENVEMSLRIWMCGGELLIHPCSHVGHVFRSHTPYSFPGGVSKVIYKNTRRLIDVWTDEYRNFFYLVDPGLRRVYAGDVSARVKLRRDLKCKSFKWYLDNIYPEAPVPREFIYVGQFSNPESGHCLDSMGKAEKSTPGAFECHDKALVGMNQAFIYTKQLLLQNNLYCIDLDKKRLPITVKFTVCNGEIISQQWVYNKKTKQLKNKDSYGCLSINNLNMTTLIVNRCDKNNQLQKWELSRRILKSD